MAPAFVCQKCGMEIGDEVRLNRNGKHADCGGGIIERVVVEAARRNDPYTADCLDCKVRPCEPNHDYCVACLVENETRERFGRCYHCRDFHDHDSCIGVPCECPCPSPNRVDIQRIRDEVLAKLTPDERRALGY